MIASDCERGLIPSAGSSLLMHDAPVVDSSFPAIGHHHPRHGDHQPQQRRREEEEGEEQSRNVVRESKSRSGTPTTNEGVTDLCRVCAHCKTTKTPLWRSGPSGPKSLCNACGIRYRKKRRRWVDALIREEEKARNNSCQGREEAEAAVLLVALSCGFLSHQHPQPR